MKHRFENDIRKKNRAFRRKKLIWRISIYGILMLMVVCGLAWYALSEQFRVSNVDIKGLTHITEDAVREKIAVELGKKYFFVIPRNTVWTQPTKIIERVLRDGFPSIKTISAGRVFPRGLRVIVSEYEPWGVMCHNEPEECFWIDREGFIFDRAETFTGIVVPKIHDKREHAYDIHTQLISAKLMELVTYFNDHAQNDPALQSVQFTIDAGNETLRVTTRAGWDILLLESNDPENSYQDLRTVLDSEIKSHAGELEYIDLRTDRRVFYKYKSSQ